MFLEGKRWYDRHGAQRAAGPFLWVVLPTAPPPDDKEAAMKPVWHAPFKEARAFVRHVKMEQCGHWMMGEIKVGSHKQRVSGTYGCDGLPDDVERWVWEAGVPIPEEIMETWAKGGGHNGAGDEALSISAWATDNIKALRKAGRTL